MTKQGYAQVLVSAPVYDRLKSVASKNGLSLGKTIDKLLSIDTVSIPQICVNPTSVDQDPELQYCRAMLKEAGPAGFEPATTDSGGQRHILGVPALRLNLSIIWLPSRPRARYEKTTHL